MERARFAADDLSAFVARLFAAEGLPPADAAEVARALLLADLRGLSSHGIARVPAYLRRLRAGLITPRPDIRVTRPMPFSAVVDAGNAMGPVGAARAMAACMEAARTLGVGAATVRHGNHFGAASVHTLPAAREGCIALALAPGARSLAPHGSRAPLLGTNPIALAAPAGRFAPWSLDMAASIAARGHIRLAEAAGRPIPEGWALDAEGRPTTDPAAALSGVMLPFAGAKGSGLAMLVDILGGVLAGSGFAGSVRDWNADFTGPADVGHFFLVLKVEAFMPLPEFEARMETAIARLHALPPAAGFDAVRYPGERAGAAEAAHRRDGLPLDAAVQQALAAEGPGFPAPLA
jgi:LDH2 family malate/lactate/ureidoglycolate dehydrogenase